MANIVDKVRIGLANMVAPKNWVQNAYAKAFYGWGGKYTFYDQDRKTYLTEGYGLNPVVYSIVNQMAKKTASVPYSVKKVVDKNSQQKLRQLYQSTKGEYSPQQAIKRAILETKAFDSKELAFPLDKPNETQTWTEIWSLYKTFLVTTGNAYFYMLRPEDGPNEGIPKQLYILPSHMIDIVLKQNADMLDTESPIDHYQLTEGLSYLEFAADDVIHVKLPNPFFDMQGGHLYGLSPLRAALKNIESSNEAAELNIKTLKNGGAFGFLHGKGAPLTAPQAQQIKDRLVEMDTNTERLSKIAGVSGEIAFTRVSLTTDELKPFEFLKWDQKTIANVLGWSDSLLNNDDGGKYDKQTEERKRMITDNIMPDLKLLEQALNNRFLPLFKGYENTVIEFDASELPEMQADVEKLVKWLTQALDRGVINRDEFRSAIKYQEVGTEEMKTYTVGMNVVPLEDALIPAQDFNTAFRVDE